MAFIQINKPAPSGDFLDRHPNAALWGIAVGQAAAMLGINVVLRWLVL